MGHRTHKSHSLSLSKCRNSICYYSQLLVSEVRPCECPLAFNNNKFLRGATAQLAIRVRLLMGRCYTFDKANYSCLRVPDCHLFLGYRGCDWDWDCYCQMINSDSIADLVRLWPNEISAINANTLPSTICWPSPMNSACRGNCRSNSLSITIISNLYGKRQQQLPQQQQHKPKQQWPCSECPDCSFKLYGLQIELNRGLAKDWQGQR